jgi:hypothetical protein
MLKGTLDDFTLPDVFRLMSFAKKTGCVDVVRSAGQGKVYFREGEVYYAESSLSKEPLGQKLVRSRALTEGQLMKALDEQASSKERLGAVLINSGLVTEDQLESAVRQQIEDAIFDLLRWELGEFEWAPDAQVATEVQIGVSVENLIMEASRRLDEYEVIKRKIPSGLSVLGMAATPPEGAVEINITPQEWRILVLVDGSRTVQDIAQMVGLDEFGAMRILYGLVSAGLIELIGEGSYAPSASESVADVLVEEVTPEPVAVDPEPEPEPEPVVEAVPEPEPAPEPVVEAEPEPLSAAAEALRSQPISDEIAADLIASLEGASAPDLQAVDDVETVAATPETLTMDVADLESFGIAPLEAVPDIPAASTDDAAWTEAAGIESFDAPAPDELVTSTPDVDQFVSDLFAEPSTPPVAEEPPAPPAAPVEPEIPVSSAPSGDEPSVDRAAVVRELAGLFSDEERPRARPSMPPPAEGSAADDERKRVEDDDQVTKGIISRLIDGVKGL